MSLGDLLVAGLIKDPEDAGRIIAAALTQAETSAAAAKAPEAKSAEPELETKAKPKPEAKAEQEAEATPEAKPLVDEPEAPESKPPLDKVTEKAGVIYPKEGRPQQQDVQKRLEAESKAPDAGAGHHTHIAPGVVVSVRGSVVDIRFDEHLDRKSVV